MQDPFISLGVIVSIALIGSIIALRFKIPPVIGLLLFGMLIGPFGLKIVTDTNFINIFAEIGAILLLFLIGVEFSVSKLKRFGLTAVLVTFFKDGLVFMLGYELSLLLGLSTIQGLYIGLILAFTSTALSMRILSDLELVDKYEVPLVISVCIIEDILFAFVLAVLSSMVAGPVTLSTISISIIKAVILFSLTFTILQRSLPYLVGYVSRFETEETMQFFGISLCAFMSYIAYLLGFSPAVGAFLAGSLVTTLPQGQIVEKTLKSFALIFISFFFLSIGMFANPFFILSDVGLFVVLLFVLVLGHFAGGAVGGYLLGFSGQSSVFIGASLIPLGEMSLILAKSGLSSGIITSNILGMISFLVVISSLITLPAVNNYMGLHFYLRQRLPESLKKFGTEVGRDISTMKSEFEPGGEFFLLFTNKLRQLLLEILVITAVIAPLMFFENFLLSNELYYKALTVSLLIILYPLYRLFKDLLELLDNLSLIFTRSFYRVGRGPKERAFKEFLYAFALLFSAFFIIPPLFTILKIGFLSIPALIFFIFLSITYMFDASRQLKILISKREFSR